MRLGSGCCGVGVADELGQVVWCRVAWGDTKVPFGDWEHVVDRTDWDSEHDVSKTQ